ncbi:hypothetical protein pb186bvf_018989 [Paramecium bursaria]
MMVRFDEQYSSYRKQLFKNKTVLKLRQKRDFENHVPHAKEIFPPRGRDKLLTKIRDNTKMPIDNKKSMSCECSECGQQKMKLVSKEKKYGIAYHQQISRRKVLMEKFRSCVHNLLSINRIKRAGIEFFAKRMQIKQQTKTINNQQQNQIQFLKKHFRIDVMQLQDADKPKSRPSESRTTFKLKSNRRIRLKFSNQLSNQNTPRYYDVDAYTSRSRSNRSVYQYVQQKLSMLPDLQPFTTRSNRSESQKHTDTPYRQQIQYLFRSISISKKL